MTVNFLIEKDYFSRRLEYVVRIVSHRLGYPFRIISNIKDIETEDITITYFSEDKLQYKNIHSAINIFNSKQIINLDEAERIVNLFEWKKYTLPVIGTRFEKKDLVGYKLSPAGIYYQKSKLNAWIIPVDIFLNVFYHLSRYEEKWRHFTEETATDYSTSILSRHQNLKIPVVDVFISFLDKIVRDRIKVDQKIAVKVLAWPGGEEMGVALTHDVDITRGFQLKDRLVKIGRGYLDKMLGKAETLSAVKEEIKEKDSIAWNLPELINTYSLNGWKVTFFFIAKMIEGTHVRYNVFSRKFRKLFKELSENDHEIALHPSKFAFDKPRSYRDEKEKLESACGHKIEGMRQHYLRAKFPRLWVFTERAALSYDSSLGYNYQAGFRAGTCHSFKTYDVFEDKPLAVTEFSLHFFENNLPDPTEDLEHSKKIITDLITEVSTHKGLLVGLLHPSNFGQKSHRDLWNYLIAVLKKKKIYVTTLHDHLKWQRLLERIRLKLTDQNKDIPRLNISLPAGTKKITIELIGNLELQVPKKLKIKNIRKGCYTISTNSQRLALSLKKTDRA